MAGVGDPENRHEGAVRPRGVEEYEGGSSCEEALEPVRMRDPREPSREERFRHEMTHLPLIGVVASSGSWVGGARRVIPGSPKEDSMRGFPKCRLTTGARREKGERGHHPRSSQKAVAHDMRYRGAAQRYHRPIRSEAG